MLPFHNLLCVAILFGLCLTFSTEAVDLQVFRNRYRAFAKQLLKDYDSSVSPIGNSTKVMDINTKCYARMTLRESERYMKMFVQLVLNWTDKRLAWDKQATGALKVLRAHYREKKAPIWTATVRGIKKQNVWNNLVINPDGTVKLRQWFRFNSFCFPVMRHRFPADKLQCYFSYNHPIFYQLSCGNRSGLACCINKFATKRLTLWSPTSVKQFNRTRPDLGYTYFRLGVLFSRNGAPVHFYITPVVILALMTALHSLVRRTTSGVLTVVAIMLAVLDMMMIVHDVPVIRAGGGERLANLCACVLLFNAINLMWSAVAQNVLAAGGIDCEVFKVVTDFADRYRLFLILPPFEESKKEGEANSTSQWRYLSLLVDRLLSAIWLLVVVVFAAVI